MGYEPPLCEEGQPMDRLDELAPGVFGYAIEKNGLIYIPLVESKHKGQGRVGSFLESLTDRCVFPNVISPILAGMLKRRGYVVGWEWSEIFREPVDIWCKPQTVSKLQSQEANS